MGYGIYRERGEGVVKRWYLPHGFNPTLIHTHNRDSLKRRGDGRTFCLVDLTIKQFSCTLIDHTSGIAYMGLYGVTARHEWVHIAFDMLYEQIG